MPKIPVGFGIVTPAADVYYNSMSIVPEPSSVMMLLAGCMFCFGAVAAKEKNSHFDRNP